MKNGTILFDIDRTIFDTDGPSIIRNQAILKILGYPPVEEFNKVKSDYKLTLKNEREYIPEDYVKMLCDKYNFKNIDALIDTYYGNEYNILYKKSVYPEFLKIAKILISKYRLGIFSEGYKRFRENRLKAMNIAEYIDSDLIFMFDAKDTSEAISKLPKESIVVDDKERICQFLTDNGFRAIWINRKDKRKSDNFETIYSLLELPAIL